MCVIDRCRCHAAPPPVYLCGKRLDATSCSRHDCKRRETASRRRAWPPGLCRAQQYGGCFRCRFFCYFNTFIRVWIVWTGAHRYIYLYIYRYTGRLKILEIHRHGFYFIYLYTKIVKKKSSTFIIFQFIRIRFFFFSSFVKMHANLTQYSFCKC